MLLYQLSLVFLAGTADAKRTKKIKTDGLKEAVARMEASLGVFEERYQEAKVPQVKFDPEQLVRQLIDLVDSTQGIIDSHDDLVVLKELKPTADDLMAQYLNAEPASLTSMTDTEMAKKKQEVAKSTAYVAQFALENHDAEDEDHFYSKGRRALLSIKTSSLGLLTIFRTVITGIKERKDRIGKMGADLAPAYKNLMSLVGLFQTSIQTSKKAIAVINHRVDETDAKLFFSQSESESSAE